MNYDENNRLNGDEQVKTNRKIVNNSSEKENKQKKKHLKNLR